jgi:guanylate kinase
LKYRSKLQEDILLTISLKYCDEVEEATHNFIRLLQDAARQATPQRLTKRHRKHPAEIKKLLAEKRKARAKWQRSYAHQTKRLIIILAATANPN